MSEKVTMPALGESVTEGTVTRWLKAEGDTVAIDEPLLEVATDKVDTEVPSPIAGVVEKILVPEDETVEVGAELVIIGDGSGSAAPPAAPEVAASPMPPAAVSEVSSSPAPTPSPAAAPPEDAGETVKMPALGESVTEGTVTRWLKQTGDQVAVDEPLLEVATDKVDTEVPSPVAGIVQAILVAEDETVEVGADLVVIGSAAPTAVTASTPEVAASAPEPAAPAPIAAPTPPPEPVAAVAAPLPAPPAPTPTPPPPAPAAPAAAVAPAPVPQAAGGPYAVPLVRKLAAKHGIDLATISGSGVGKRIRKQDVLDAVAAREAAAALPAPAAAPAPAPLPAATGAPTTILPVSDKRGGTEKLSRMRKVIASRMVESLQVSAQLTTVVEVDVTKVAALRASKKDAFLAATGEKLSFMPFFAQAAIEALQAYPQVNATIAEDSISYPAHENLGIAVDTEKGLMVPVIHQADTLSFSELATRINDTAHRTRTGKITPDDLSGGTFTLTNTGSRGALFDTPIINQPQLAILGTGAIVKRPVVVTDAAGGEAISIRSMCYLALSYDHRIIDGADAARFLSAMKNRLEEGAFQLDNLG